MDDDVQRAGRLALYLGSRANRARLFGARVEMCAFLVARRPSPALLIVKSQYGPWMTCQEGVRFGESFDAALWRGLAEELGIDIDPEERPRCVDDRGMSYLGTLKLSRDRWDRGVRSVAPGVPDEHPLARVKMRRKAYWGLYRQIAERDLVDPVPNGTEVVDFDWVPLAEARRRFGETSSARKARVLSKGLDMCEKVMAGTDLHPPRVA